LLKNLILFRTKFLNGPLISKIAIGYFVVNEIIGIGVVVLIYKKISDGIGKLGVEHHEIEIKEAAEDQYKSAQERIYRLEQELQNLKWQAMSSAGQRAGETLHKDAHSPLPGPAQTGARVGEERDFEIAVGTTIRMCWIPPGKFVMGSPADEVGRQDDQEAPHDVVIRKGFWMAKTELTQKQWHAAGGLDTSGRPPESKVGMPLMIYLNKSGLLNHVDSRGDDLPVERIEWTEAKSCCNELTKRQHASGDLSVELEYDLPTEAEWEYACRAGTLTALNNSGNLPSDFFESCVSLGEVAWYDDNSGDKPHAVGLKTPNNWGLHDMHGNVTEWCDDIYLGKTHEESSDFKDPAGLTYRVLRGGGYSIDSSGCRASSRHWNAQSYFDKGIGMRPVLHLLPIPSSAQK
jgi:formylglycine-generating enzyme required for sulfatase activity